MKMIGDEFIQKSRHYSFSYALYSTAWWLGWYITPLHRMCMWGFKHKDTYVKNYLYQKLGEVISSYRVDAGDTKERISEDEYPIWVFWYQGFQFAPPLVRACLENLKRRNAYVNVVDKDNLDDYVAIPSYIKDKVAKGIITFTHYSDIIRVSLLAQYGGIWIDSTCFVAQEIPSSVKQLPLYSSKTINRKPLPLWSNSRWCGWGIGSAYKAYPLFCFLKEMLYRYWEKENMLIDYLLVDALIEIGFETNQDVHRDMDALPENNLQRNRLWMFMNSPFDEGEYKKMTSDTWLFKLSYKTALTEKTSSGEDTYYHKLLKLALD